MRATQQPAAKRGGKTYPRCEPKTNLCVEGTPICKPIHAHNIDVSLEDYLPEAGIVSFGVFYKKLRDYIVPAVTNQTFPTTGIFAGFNGVPVHVITFTNASDARALG